MSPLQRAVYWRLSLVFLLTPLVFFLDIFTVAIFATTCRLPGNGSEHRTADVNQSRPTDEPDSVCAWTEWLPYSQTLFMVGMLLGSLFGGAISDRYGKRPMLLVCLCMQAVCGPVPAALPHPLFFLAVRCLTGLCFCCINISSFSLAVEWTPPLGRLWSSAFLPFCFSLGTMGVAPLAWLSSTWTTLHLAMGLPLLVCLPLFFCIPESPRWLLLKKKAALLDRYRQNSAADKQCIDLLLDSAWTDLQKAAEAQQALQDRGHTPSDTVLLKHPTILLRLFTMSYLSAVSALTYYGICMNVGSFGVDVYSAQFFSGLSETPCLLIPLVRLGRRALSVITLLLSSASCFLSLLLSMLDAPPEITMTLALLGKLCILASIFISVLYSIELFPTIVRQRCVSLVNLSFRVGCLVNSLVPPNPNGAISLAAMLVYSSGPLLGCALCLLLPETSAVPLPDSVEECELQPRPRLPTLSAIRWPRKLPSSQTGKAAAEPAEKEETNTHSGFI